VALLDGSGLNDLRDRCIPPAPSGQEISGLALFPLLHFCFCIRSNVISNGLARRMVTRARRSGSSRFRSCLESVRLLRFGCAPYFDRGLIDLWRLVFANGRFRGRPFKKDRRFPLLSVQRNHRTRPAGVSCLPLDLEVKATKPSDVMHRTKHDRLDKVRRLILLRWPCALG
jgi:hypothetical protein